jgi:Uncharacterized protein conserved in bacteria
MEFEFDPKKSATNLRKHGVSFADAEAVFYDEQALTREDADSSGEARFVTVGIDALGRILTVCWTERGQNIRLISARPSTHAERKTYES